MPFRSALTLSVALAAGLSVNLGCSKTETQVLALEVGHHHLQLAVPEGWEHLDHGRQQLFRQGECQVSLTDMGVATREGLVRDLRRAEILWREGRHEDAYARVLELRGPMFQGAPRGQVAEFWSPWTDVTYYRGPADRAEVGAAIRALIANTAMFEEVTAEHLLEYVLSLSLDMRRYEIANQSSSAIHGSDWIDIESWDRVSHMSQSRLAYTQSGGYLLVLAIERGLRVQADAAFEAVLTSIEIEPAEEATR